MSKTFDFVSGEVLLFDKPKGWTSFDVVNKVRNMIGGVKVGHAGTLDPLATGLLILCTGNRTKDISIIQDADKAYVADVVLGATTSSYDAEFPPGNLQPADHLTEAEVQLALRQFVGVIQQQPPSFSAVKVGGRRAYKLARAGKEVSLNPRTVRIDEIQLLEMSTIPEHQVRLTLVVRCSKGTYIRSLAHDLGQQLGVGGYLADLRRTAIGSYRVEDAWTLEAFAVALAPRH